MADPIRLRVEIDSGGRGSITGLEKIVEGMTASLQGMAPKLDRAFSDAVGRIEAAITRASSSWSNQFRKSFSGLESQLLRIENILDRIAAKSMRVGGGAGGAGGVGGAGGAGGGNPARNNLDAILAGLSGYNTSGGLRTTYTPSSTSVMQQLLNEASGRRASITTTNDELARIVLSPQTGRTTSQDLMMQELAAASRRGAAQFRYDQQVEDARRKGVLSTQQQQYNALAYQSGVRLLGGQGFARAGQLFSGPGGSNVTDIFRNERTGQVARISRETGDLTMSMERLNREVQRGDRLWGSFIIRLSAFLYSAKTIARVIDAIAIAPFRSVASATINATEEARNFQLGISGVAGGIGAAQGYDQALQLAIRNRPVTLADARQSGLALAAIPALSSQLSTGNQQSGVNSILRFNDIATRLGIIDPAQGTAGAIVSLREISEGDYASLRRRFGYDISQLARVSGKRVDQLKGDPSGTIDALGQLLDILLPQSAFEQRSGLVSNQYQKLQDSFKTGFQQVGESGVFDALSGQIRKFREELDKFLDTPEFAEKAQSLSDSMQRLFFNMGNGLEAFLRQLSGDGGASISSVEGLVDIVDKSFERLADFSENLPQIGNAIGVGAKALFDGVISLVDSINALAEVLRNPGAALEGGIQSTGAYIFARASGLDPKTAGLVAKMGAGGSVRDSFDFSKQFGSAFQPYRPPSPEFRSAYEGLNFLSPIQGFQSRLGRIPEAPVSALGKLNQDFISAFTGNLGSSTDKFSAEQLTARLSQKLSDRNDLRYPIRKALKPFMGMSPVAAKLIADLEARMESDRLGYEEALKSIASSTQSGYRNYVIGAVDELGRTPSSESRMIELLSGQGTLADIAMLVGRTADPYFSRESLQFKSFSANEQVRLVQSLARGDGGAGLSLQMGGEFDAMGAISRDDLAGIRGRGFGRFTRPGTAAAQMELGYLGDQVLPRTLEARDSALRAFEKAGYDDGSLAAANDVLGQVVERMRELEDLADPVRESFLRMAEGIRSALQEGIGQGISDLIRGTGSLEDAFRRMADGIINTFSDIAAQNIVQLLLGNFGTPGAGATPGGLFGSLLQGIGGLFKPAGAVPAKTGAFGGIWPGFTPFWTGGIASGPTLGLVGEGGRPEAIVPLPDGRSIPVSMFGGGGEPINVIIVNSAAEAAMAAMKSSRGRSIIVDAVSGNVASGGKLAKMRK